MAYKRGESKKGLKWKDGKEVQVYLLATVHLKRKEWIWWIGFDPWKQLMDGGKKVLVCST